MCGLTAWHPACSHRRCWLSARAFGLHSACISAALEARVPTDDALPVWFACPPRRKDMHLPRLERAVSGDSRARFMQYIAEQNGVLFDGRSTIVLLGYP